MELEQIAQQAGERDERPHDFEFDYNHNWYRNFVDAVTGDQAQDSVRAQELIDAIARLDHIAHCRRHQGLQRAGGGMSEPAFLDPIVEAKTRELLALHERSPHIRELELIVRTALYGGITIGLDLSDAIRNTKLEHAHEPA